MGIDLEVLRNLEGPKRELLEEAVQAIELALERERSAKDDIGRIQIHFLIQCGSLEERAAAAENNADLAERKAAQAEHRLREYFNAIKHLQTALKGCR